MSKKFIESVPDYYEELVKEFINKVKYFKLHNEHHKVLSTDWQKDKWCLRINTISFSYSVYQKNEVKVDMLDELVKHESFVVNTNDFVLWANPPSLLNNGVNQFQLFNFFSDIEVLEEEEFWDKFKEFDISLCAKFSKE